MSAAMNLGRRASFLLPLSLVGCRKTASPAAAAEAFLDAYYLERDHARALALCADGAEARVKQEQQLRAEAGGAYGVQPRVSFQRTRETARDDGSQELTYALAIDSSGVELRKTVVLRVRKYGEDWKVSAFLEQDQEGEARSAPSTRRPATPARRACSAAAGSGRTTRASSRTARWTSCNACLGLARAEGMDPQLDALARRLQEELFTVGSMLATPQGSKAEAAIPKVKPDWVKAMEDAIDAFDRELPAMTSFILPGGTKAAAALHVARTVCRRAERRAVPLYRAGKIDLLVIGYLNRLSDLLFTMARAANHRAKVEDVKWVPPKD